MAWLPNWRTEGRSKRLESTGALLPGREWNCVNVPQVVHRCEYAAPLRPVPRCYGVSLGAGLASGLNQHGVRFVLYLGLLLPYMEPGRKYRSDVLIHADLPLFGLPAYYWGNRLVVQGTTEVTWGLEPETGKKGVSYLASGTHLRGSVPGGAPGRLFLCPFDVVVEAFHGPRMDVHLCYVQCRWLETHYPPPSGSYLPAMYA